MTVFDEARHLRGAKDVKEARGPLTRHLAKWGLIFISPWIIGFLLFTLIPMVLSLLMTFTNFNITEPDSIRFIGLENYARLFTDADLRAASASTFKFFLLAIPFAIIQPIVMAAMLNAKPLRGKRYFTTLFYMTYMVPLVSAILIWQGMLNGEDVYKRQLLPSGTTRPRLTTIRQPVQRSGVEAVNLLLDIIENLSLIHI